MERKYTRWQEPDDYRPAEVRMKEAFLHGFTFRGVVPLGVMIALMVFDIAIWIYILTNVV